MKLEDRWGERSADPGTRFTPATWRLLRALQAARADGTGVVLTAGEAEELARILAHLARGAEPAPRTPGERVRLLARMVGEVA